MDLQVSVPYLRSEYGKEYDFDAPVKLLDSMMHAMADKPDQQVVVLCQVSDHILVNLSAFMRVGDQAMSGKPLFQWAFDVLGCELLGVACIARPDLLTSMIFALCLIELSEMSCQAGCSATMQPGNNMYCG